MNAKRLSIIVGAVIVVMIVGWLGFLVRAELPGAGEPAEEAGTGAPAAAQPKEASNGQATLQVRFEPEEGAQVGDLMTFTARVTDASGRPVPYVQFTVQHWHTEDEKVVFGAQAVAPDGTLTWKFNAHDGVPYEIRVTAAPTAQSPVQFAPLSVRPVAEVAPLAPPLRVKLLNLFYLVGVVALGVAAGLWLAFRRAAAAERGRPAPRRVVMPALGR